MQKFYVRLTGMAEENISQECRLKIGEARNYFFEEIKQNDSVSKKHKQVCMALNYIDKSLILVSAVTEYISVSVFPSLISVIVGITSSALELKICTTTTGIQEYNSIIKKKEKNQ